MLRQAQQNGIFSFISNLFPFVLSSSKDSERVFQQPAKLTRSFQKKSVLSPPSMVFLSFKEYDPQQSLDIAGHHWT